MKKKVTEWWICCVEERFFSQNHTTLADHTTQDFSHSTCHPQAARQKGKKTSHNSWKLNLPEKLQGKLQKNYRKSNIYKIKEYRKICNESNKDKIKEYSKICNESNKDKIKENIRYILI